MVLFERIGPYHFARLSALAAHVETVAIEMFGMDNTYAWHKVDSPSPFTRLTLAESQSAASHKELMGRLLDQLESCKPSFVAIPGWIERTSLAALRWCVDTDTPAIVMSASSAVGKSRSRWLEMAKGTIVRQFSAGIGGGTPQVEYLKDLGLEGVRVFPGYNVVDNDYYARESSLVRQHAEEHRNRLHLPEKFFLSVSRFIPEKNLSSLLRAYHGYRRVAGSGAWHLVLLGDGPLKSEIETLIDDLELHDWVHLCGFKQVDETPTYYGLASAFVLASVSETWGLVVNEAMASGLPVLVSDHCGCARDLVRDHSNGFTFHPLDIARMQKCMVDIAGGSVDLDSMGEESRRMIADWPLDVFAVNMLRAATVACSSAPRRAGRAGRLLLNTLISR